MTAGLRVKFLLLQSASCFKAGIQQFLKAKDTPWKYQARQMQCLIFAAKMNAMTLMEESVCIRPTAQTA